MLYPLRIGLPNSYTMNMLDFETSHIPDYRYRNHEDLPLTVQQFLMRSGVASRRGSAALMREGRVKVNGKQIYTFALKIDPLIDQVFVDDHQIPWRQSSITLVLNKPWGILTTMMDPYSRPCVADYIPCDKYPGLYPLGRLDKDTTGVLLFSTDGQLGRYLLQPKYHVKKTYLALIDGVPSEHELAKLREGVLLEDGLTAPAQAHLLEGEDAEKARALFRRIFSQDTQCDEALSRIQENTSSFISLTIHEGRMHQVKRMMQAIGYTVRFLHRQEFAGITVSDLQPGQWRILQDEEVTALKALVVQNSPSFPTLR